MVAVVVCAIKGDDGVYTGGGGEGVEGMDDG